MRELIPAHEVAVALDAAKATCRRTDDAYQGLEWRLSRRPDHGVHIGDGYYRFDDNEVLISAIRLFLMFKYY